MDKEFIKLFNLYKNDVYRLVFSYVANYSDADDITQAVFIKLYKNINKFDDKLSVKKWLAKVSINECKSFFLSSWYKKIKPLTNQDDIALENKEDNTLNVILKLPRKYRLVIYCYYYEEYKIKEIATILKMNENTIKTNLKRAKEMLKKYLKEEDE